MAETRIVEEFLKPEMLRNPLPFLAEAREKFPVFRSFDNQGREIYVVTCYKFVKEAFGRPGDFSSEFGHLIRAGSANPEADAILQATGFDYEKMSSLILTVDEPEHKRRRNLVSPAFTLSAVNRLTDALTLLADDLIDTFIESGECDLIHDFAVPYSLGAILRVLGLELSLIPRAYTWSQAATTRLDDLSAADSEIAAARALVDMLGYMRGRVRQLRANPGDDLVSHVITSSVDGERSLSDDEVVGFMHETLFAGNETSRNSLVAALALLLRNADQMEILRHDPSLLPNVIEETLRHHSTGLGIWRIARHDTQLGGVDIPAGAALLLRQDSANRDETMFPNADKFDITRKNAKQHLTFGYGIHHCIGQALARKEMVIGLERLLDRLKNIELVNERCDFERELNVIIHALKKVYIRFDPGTRMA